MGSLLQIRNVPDDARRVLKARAAARGQSLNSYLLAVISRETSRPTSAEVFDRAARRGERTAVSALDIIDEARSERDESVPRTSSA